MLKRLNRPRSAWLPIVTGLIWMWFAYSFGLIGFLVGIIPGGMLLSSGVSALLYPGDYRIPRFIGFGGLLGTVLALPVLLLTPVLMGIILLLLSAACFVAAGYIALRQEFFSGENIPPPRLTPRLAAEAALDDSLIAMGSIVAPGYVDYDPQTLYREVETALALFQDRGWLQDPASFHTRPPPLEAPRIQPRLSGKLPYEHLIFNSGYEPDPAAPGRERWLSYSENREAHVWLLRHQGPPRPWIVAIHGFGMGEPWQFFNLFRTQRLHHELGLNVALPILPHHGPRRVGKLHGQGLNSGDVMDMIHAEGQAMWDIRRLLTWLREHQEAPRIGIGGVSLGGYNTALLASLEGDLACAIAAVPLSNPARQGRFHSPALPLRYAESHGLDSGKVTRVMDVISPLAMTPQIPRENLYILGGVGDRIVPLWEVYDLWLHWERPAILWYQGAHVTLNSHPETAEFVGSALRKSGLISSNG